MRFFWGKSLQPYCRFGARWGPFSAMRKTQPQEPPTSDERFRCSVFHYAQPYHSFGGRGSYSISRSTQPQGPPNEHFKCSRFSFCDEVIREGEKIHILRGFHNLMPLQTHVASFRNLSIVDAEETARELFRNMGKALRLVNSQGGHLHLAAIADIIIHDRSIFFHYLQDKGDDGQHIKDLLDVFKCLLQMLRIKHCEGEFALLFSDMEKDKITTSHDLLMHPTLFNLHHRRHIMFIVRHRMNRNQWGLFKFVGNTTCARKWKKFVKSTESLYACLFLSEKRGAYPDGDEGLILFTRNMWGHWPAFMKIIKADLGFSPLIDSDRLLEFFIRRHISLFFVYLYQFYQTLERNHQHIHTT